MTTFNDMVYVNGGVPILPSGVITGNVFFVGSAVTGATDAANYGKSPKTPFATLSYAISACTASNGDVIYLLPGHAETKAASGSLWAASVIGVKIIGVGSGSLRPTFTLSHTGAVTTITAASVWLENVLFVAGIDSVVAPLTISAADVTLKDVEFRDTTDIEFVAGPITTAAANRLTIDGLVYDGYTGGNACTIGVKLVGVDNAVIKNCKFTGLFSTGCINLVTTASTNVTIDNCEFLNTGTAVTKDVVETGSLANTWRATRCWDGVAGYVVEGSNVRPLQYSGGPIITTYQTVSPLPNNTLRTCFTYIGAIEILELYGVVTTEIQNQATNTKFQVFPSSQAAATDVCAVVDTVAFDVGSVVRATLDFSDAAIGADDTAIQEGEAYAAKSAVTYGAAITSAIGIHTAAASTGAFLVVLKWLPHSIGAYVDPA